ESALRCLDKSACGLFHFMGFESGLKANTASGFLAKAESGDDPVSPLAHAVEILILAFQLFRIISESEIILDKSRSLVSGEKTRIDFPEGINPFTLICDAVCRSGKCIKPFQNMLAG